MSQTQITHFISPHTVTLGYGDTAKSLPIRHLNGDDEMHVFEMIRALIWAVIQAQSNTIHSRQLISDFFYELLAYCINMPGDERVSAEYLKSCSEQQRSQAARAVLETNRESLRELLGMVPGRVKKVGINILSDLFKIG